MRETTLAPVEEYLNASYADGDREYVDGRIVERNLGEIDHSDLQGRIYLYLAVNCKSMWVGPEVRVQVAQQRFRVPDIDDRAGDVQEKIDDYLAFGIPCVWVIDPRTRRGFMYTVEGMREAKDGIMQAQEIVVPLSELFD